MNKLVVSIIGILIGFVLLAFLVTSRKQSPTNFQPKITPPVSTTAANLKKYIDPSGFSFQYPETLTVSSKEPLNQEIYSSIEITDASSSGKINLLVESSSLKNIDDLFKTDKKMATLSGKIKSLKLADIDARQFDLATTRTTVALDQEALITIKTVSSSQPILWFKAHDIIVSTFAFTPPSDTTQNTDNDNTGGGDVIYEGEETIE